MKKIPFMPLALLIFALVSAVFAAPSSAGEYEKTMAKEIGGMLVSQFKPDAISVTVSRGGSFAWVEATGAKIDKVRIDNMKLSALLKNMPKKLDTTDKKALASLIMTSFGEITLLEKDVNDYFSKGKNTKGFSDLSFDFTPKGFTARGLFTDKLIITIRIRLKAFGNLALRKDGIYLVDTSIYTEGVKQPDPLSNMIVKRLNPLLPFSKIPFPVNFKRITITDTAAIVTGDPKPLAEGETWSMNSR